MCALIAFCNPGDFIFDVFVGEEVEMHISISRQRFNRNNLFYFICRA
jgi:hypothetical protein